MVSGVNLHQNIVCALRSETLMNIQQIEDKKKSDLSALDLDFEINRNKSKRFIFLIV